MPGTSPQLAFTQADLAALARKLLDLRPDPAPRCRILRDLLRCPPGDAQLLEAERGLLASRGVAELAAAQQPDGTWGRFHSQNTSVKTAFPTTEYAVCRALALGLDRRSPLLQKTVGFIEDHLEGRATWSDPPEKHDDPRVFPYNIRSVSAGILALIDPHHPLLEPFWQHWAALVEAAFASGSYDAQAELARHQALSGIPSRRLLPFHPYYPLLILSATRSRLPAGLERSLLAFLFHKPDGIYYVCSCRLDALPSLQEKWLISWLHGHEVLSRFQGWKDFAPPVLNWLWSQRGETGLWDAPPLSGRSCHLPLSESWRKSANRRMDYSVKIMSLLQRYFDEN